MRIIKFRAWNKKEKIMVYDNEDDTEDYNYEGLVSNDLQLMNYVLKNNDDEWYKYMQFTGVKDMDNSDIYEDDIIEYKHAIHPIRIIIFEGASFKYKIDEIDSPSAIKTLDSRIAYNDMKVIGNIHENPELLKGL